VIYLRLTLKGQLRNLEALVRALLGRNDRSIADKRIVDTGVGDQVGLELVEINVKSTVESKTGCDGADNLSNQAV
jgi:hypothetical protein